MTTVLKVLLAYLFISFVCLMAPVWLLFVMLTDHSFLRDVGDSLKNSLQSLLSKNS